MIYTICDNPGLKVSVVIDNGYVVRDKQTEKYLQQLLEEYKTMIKDDNYKGGEKS